MKSPIFTEKTICRDCYKCVRQCPVKAIKVENGSAVVMHELCIFCGRCIQVCPVNAKKLRSDISRARQLISLGYDVAASIAPSFPAEFDCTTAQLIEALHRLGFSRVSETATGAVIVSRMVAGRLNYKSKRIISSACPTVIQLIKKYKPELIDYTSDLVSPLHAHAEYLKKLYGMNTKVVFIGPCIAKKLEADDETTPIDLAITFIELRSWLEDEKINPSAIEVSDDIAFFTPSTLQAASEFAVEGGMLNTIKSDTTTIDSQLISCSGVQNILSILDDIRETAESETKSLFLELLACDGGCISGRGMTRTKGYLTKRLKILEYKKNQSAILKEQPENPDKIELILTASPVRKINYSEEDIETVLKSIDKLKKEDELNCGGCGYNTCRDFAAALLEGKAEHSMCVTNMRKLAEKKSNALMKALPLGVVIIDKNNRIIECNSKFIEQFSEIETDLNSTAADRIEGADLSSFMPDCSILTRARKANRDLVEEKIRIYDKIYRIFVFRIGGEDITGAVFQDITSPAVRRETIIRKTEEVIEKSLNSVQQIASLLGENAAETQLILNSLIDSYNNTGARE